MPLFCALGGFKPSSAVALSNVTVVGGALANFAANFSRHHPASEAAPLIDWTLILVRAPPAAREPRSCRGVGGAPCWGCGAAPR